MKASETNLLEIIEGSKQYIIPMFQRTYTWREKHWKQLWDDINELFEDDIDMTHFIGSIVTIPYNMTNHGVQPFLVIDGQQRLTTLLLMLVVIRDIAEERNEMNLHGEIHNTLLINMYKSGEDQYKLLPTQIDKECFKKIMNKELADEHEEALILKAYNFYYKLIKKIENLNEIKKLVTSKLSIVSIILDSDDNPYVVFESLNAKGEPLTEADLIRNYIFMRIQPDEQEDFYSRYWLPMQKELDDDLTEFLRHFLLGININVKTNNIYMNFKHLISNGNVKEMLVKLSNFASYYKKFLDPLKEQDIKIRMSLQRIKEFEAKTAYPFLLYIYNDYKEGKYSQKQMYRSISFIENYLVRRYVCGIDSKPLNKIFAAMYNQISTYSSSDSIEEIIAYLQNRGYPKDYEVKTALISNNLYGQSDRRKKVLFLLKCIEYSFSHKEMADLSNVTLEHIMPQTLTEKWIDELGENYEEIHLKYLDTLGNLTLTAYNSELSNEPFIVKKKYYKDSNILLNKELTKVSDWNEDSIVHRSEELTKIFLSIWPYFGKAENEETKITGTSPRLLYILEDTFSVKTWREVMKQTVIYIYENFPQEYQNILVNNQRIISESDKNLRRPLKLVNSHYIEGNLNAKAINKFCIQIIKDVGYSENEWGVELEVK